MRGALAAGALLASLGACGPGAPDLSEARGLALRPMAGGLAVEGSGGREIGFGRAQAGALAAMAKVAGRAPRPAACRPGREAFALGGLRVVFEAERFVGWQDASGAAGRGCGA